MSAVTKSVRQTVVERDLHHCLRCGLYVFNDPYAAVHHRRPRASGGSRAWDTNLPANLVLLCGTCHNTVESRREDAFRDGFLVRQGANPAGVPVLTATHGWVLLDNEGTYEEVTE